MAHGACKWSAWGSRDSVDDTGAFLFTPPPKAQRNGGIFLGSRYSTRQECCPGARLRAQVECMAWGCLCLCTCETPCGRSSGMSFICAWL